MASVSGDGLKVVDRLDVVDERIETLPEGATWILRGVTSFERYVTSREHERSSPCSRL